MTVHVSTIPMNAHEEILMKGHEKRPMGPQILLRASDVNQNFKHIGEFATKSLDYRREAGLSQRGAERQ